MRNRVGGLRSAADMRQHRRKTVTSTVEISDVKHMKPAEEILAFRPGDTVDVNVKIQEDNDSHI